MTEIQITQEKGVDMSLKHLFLIHSTHIALPPIVGSYNKCFIALVKKLLEEKFKRSEG